MNTVIVFVLLGMPAGPCGQDKGATPAGAWAADKGRAPGEAFFQKDPGVSMVEQAKPEFAARSFTFEAWLRWPEEAADKLQPETIAEVRGSGWTWMLALDEVGCPYINWGPGQQEFQVKGEMSYDVIHPGKWYHLAVVFDAPEKEGPPTVQLFLTEQGAAKPFCTAVSRAKGTVKPAPDAAQARIAVGRGITEKSAGLVRIGSAAFYPVARPTNSLKDDQAPLAIPADILGKAPEGVSIDDEFEMSSLGVYGQAGDGAILFSTAPRHMRNYWYAFRVRGAKGKTLVFQTTEPEPMMISPWIAEDGLEAIAGPYGGMKWTKPNRFVHRRVNIPKGEPMHFSFSHTFTSNDALIAGCPMITRTMADTWLDEVAVKKLGAKIRVIGHSPDGRPLRVAQIGNPDAPVVWFQSGQHSAVERFGYYLGVEAFERAAADADLLKKTRWLIMPVVNVDSYMVMPKAGDPNMNRVWAASDRHPTISSIRKFLETETARTGTIAAFDAHAGTVQRGNTLASGGSVNGLFEKFLAEAGHLPVVRRARPWPAPAPPAPADLTNWHPGADSRTFGGFGTALPLVRAAYTLELSTMTFRTPEGAGPISCRLMRRDGVAFYKAVKNITDAPMPEPSAAPRAPSRGGRGR